MPTTVIHIRNKRNTNNEVYIGRGSEWGNPFQIGKDGSREEVIEAYKEYAYRKLRNQEWSVAYMRNKLAGKTLVCFCKPQACHGDVLIDIIGR